MHSHSVFLFLPPAPGPSPRVPPAGTPTVSHLTLNSPPPWRPRRGPAVFIFAGGVNTWWPRREAGRHHGIWKHTQRNSGPASQSRKAAEGPVSLCPPPRPPHPTRGPWPVPWLFPPSPQEQSAPEPLRASRQPGQGRGEMIADTRNFLCSRFLGGGREAINPCGEQTLYCNRYCGDVDFLLEREECTRVSFRGVGSVRTGSNHRRLPPLWGGRGGEGGRPGVV